MIGIVRLCVPNMVDLGERCMHSMSSRLCQPPCKSHTADHILFKKESNFCTAFVSAVGRLTWESAHELCLILPHLD